MRLIDAASFIEYLGLDVEGAREENLGEIVTLEDFDRQPIAYNINRVIESLEDMENNVGDYDLSTVQKCLKVVMQGFEN